jgi:hypothetical protein
VLKNTIIEHKDNHGQIHLLYSKNELTYERQIVHLIAELNANGYVFDEQIEQFPEHNDVGKYFVPYMKEQFKKIIDN